MRFSRLLTALCSFALIASACGSSASSAAAESPSVADDPATTESLAEESSTQPLAEPVTLINEGGSFEGHTPRGFAGFGTGLFAGDELNANFPTDDGVQIWLSFELPDGVSSVTNARLQSSFLTVRGNPFETLGDLQVAPVRYDEFSPAVVSLEPVGPSTTCPTPTDNNFSCQIVDAVNAELAAGRQLVQLQLRFEGVSDPDGEQDMAMFFITDSNTNEPGIFELALS